MNSSFYTNVFSFFPKVLPKSQKLDNLRFLIWIISYLNHEIAVAYGFKNIPLIQKIYRQFIEYNAILEKLLISSEKVNQTFYEMSFVLLKETIFDDYDNVKLENKIDKISELLNLKTKDDFDKVSDYNGWTAHYNKNNKLVLTSMNEIAMSFITKVEKGSNYLKIIWKDCNAVMHSGGYGTEINNDLYNNKYGIIDYIEFMHLISLYACDNVLNFIKEYKNQKLEDSVIEIIVGLIQNKTNFEKYIETLRIRV